MKSRNFEAKIIPSEALSDPSGVDGDPRTYYFPRNGVAIGFVEEFFSKSSLFRVGIIKDPEKFGVVHSSALRANAEVLTEEKMGADLRLLETLVEGYAP